MTAWLVRWRLALRIARRDARRHRGRTLLVVAMVGLPVLAIVGADTLYRSNDVTPVEALPTTLGAADAQLVGASRDQVWADPATGSVWQQDGDAADPAWTRAEVERALPAGSRVVEEVSGQVAFRTELGYARAAGLAADLGEPLRDGVAELLEGRLPEDDGEVAISARIAHRGIEVGDELALTQDDVPVEVVGIVRTPEESGGAIVLPRGADDLIDGADSTFYADVPGGLDWPEVQELNRDGLVVLSRELAEDPLPETAWMPPGTPSAVSTSWPSTAIEEGRTSTICTSVVGLMNQWEPASSRPTIRPRSNFMPRS